MNELNYTLEFLNNKVNSKKICSQCLVLLSKKEGDKFIDKFGIQTRFYKEKYAIIKIIEQDFINKQWSFSFDLYHTHECDQLFCNINFFTYYKG